MGYNNILIKSVSRKIMVQFITNPGGQYSFSDLVSLTKSGPTNVKKAINEFKLKEIFTFKKEGAKIFYKINYNNYLVRSLFLFFAWDRTNRFSEKTRKCITVLLERFLSKNVVSVYLFGSAVYKAKPIDFDLAVVYDRHREHLEKIWLETLKDFRENIEVHFFPRKEFIPSFREGDYRITSTLRPCLVLYDQNFLFNYLKEIPLPSNNFLLGQIKSLELKLRKCFQLYKERKKDCEKLTENIFNEFLRVYISHKKEIPGSKHFLPKQARGLGLDIRKRDLWGTLEWMEATLRRVKTSI